MQMLKDLMAKMTEWLRQLTEFGFALVLVLIVIDVLFPDTSGVVKNIGTMVGQFSKEGIAGLIALLLFLLLFKHKPNSP